MNCKNQEIITVEANGAKVLELKVEPRIEQEVDRNTMVLDILNGFKEEAEEFIQEVSLRSLEKYSEILKLKDVMQKIDENTVALNMFDSLGKKAEKFIREDKTEHLDELKRKIFANTSVEEFISEPKRSMPFEFKSEKRKPERFLHQVSRIMDDKSILDPKLATISNEKKYICNVCGKIFQMQYSLTLHMNIHKEIKPHDCKICGLNFAQKPHLTSHMRTHTGERPYKCSYCPADFADVSSQRVHHRTHTNERPYVCDICGKSFPTNYLNKHKRYVHNITDTTEKSHGNIKPKPYECEICGNSFAQKPHLKRHMRTHTGERPYECSYCPATFPDASTLKKHHRTHTNERPYVCSICGKSFTTNVLKKHEREAHNMIETLKTPQRIVKLKPYECETCGRTFAQKPHLTRHMMTHTGERPCKCLYCPATFADASTLKKHHRTHTNERPYVCDICNKTFTTNVLKKHKREAHNIIDLGEKSQEIIKPKSYDCD